MHVTSLEGERKEEPKSWWPELKGGRVGADHGATLNVACAWDIEEVAISSVSVPRLEPQVWKDQIAGAICLEKLESRMIEDEREMCQWLRVVRS